MAMKRQDAWTEGDDQVLAEVTLRHIREGGTQLSAFEEVAHRLGRTPAACGFRWNSTVRKSFEQAIQSAKKERQRRNRRTYRSVPIKEHLTESSPVYSIDHIIRYLRQYKHEMNEMRRLQKQLEKELAESESELQRLEKENEEMRLKLTHMQSDYHLVNDDYRMLLKIMERAKKMAYSESEPSELVGKEKK